MLREGGMILVPAESSEFLQGLQRAVHVSWRNFGTPALDAFFCTMFKARCMLLHPTVELGSTSLILVANLDAFCGPSPHCPPLLLAAQYNADGRLLRRSAMRT
jgi:hypothetical protein